MSQVHGLSSRIILVDRNLRIPGFEGILTRGTYHVSSMQVVRKRELRSVHWRKGPIGQEDMSVKTGRGRNAMEPISF